MDETSVQTRLKDLARSASLLLDAVEGAPDRALEAVDTAFGRADVVADEQAVDVVLHDRDATVHVRRGGGPDPDGRDGTNGKNAS